MTNHRVKHVLCPDQYVWYYEQRAGPASFGKTSTAVVVYFIETSLHMDLDEAEALAKATGGWVE